MSITKRLVQLQLKPLLRGGRKTYKYKNVNVLYLICALPFHSVATKVTAAVDQNSSTFTTGGETRKPMVPRDYRMIYPEFLPDPKIEWRNPVKEKLERLDMLNRRYGF